MFSPEDVGRLSDFPLASRAGARRHRATGWVPRGVAPPPFCERLIFFASPNYRLFAGECKGWRSLISGAASQRRHRQGFWRDRRVYRQDVGGGGLLGRSPLALSCFLNTGRRGALLSHVFFSRFFSRSLLESASRRGALHSSLCSQLRRSLCSKLRSPQCRVLRSGVFVVQKKKNGAVQRIANLVVLEKC